MTRFKKIFIGAVALALFAGPGVALADGSGGHDHGDHEYQDADCTPADDANGDDSTQVVEEKEHAGNGRTECVVVDGDGTPIADALCGGHDDDCYIAYDPYQEDTTEGNSPDDRGAAIRYHNGDRYAEGGGHGHGNYGCWSLGGSSPLKNGEGASLTAVDPEDLAEATAAEDEIEARLNQEGERFTGPAGPAQYLSEAWYFYPVGAAKTFHFVRTQEPTTPEGHTVVVAEAVEVFTSGMTDGANEDDPADDGLEHFNAMFSLGNEGPIKDVYTDSTKTQVRPEFDANGDNYIDNDVTGIDYKRVEEDHLPLWQSPTTDSVCDLPWHPHTGAEGVATSFDAENPDRSAWMAHILLYANGGDIWGNYGGGDGAEAHAQWKPLNHVPAACNPHGPCL